MSSWLLDHALQATIRIHHIVHLWCLAKNEEDVNNDLDPVKYEVLVVKCERNSICEQTTDPAGFFIEHLGKAVPGVD